MTEKLISVIWADCALFKHVLLLNVCYQFQQDIKIMLNAQF